MLESQFKKKVREILLKEGFVLVQNVAGDGVPTSFPDTTIISPFGVTFYVEFKRSQAAYEAGGSSEHQQKQEYWIWKLTEMGHNAQFVYPENLERWLNEARTTKKPN